MSLKIRTVVSQCDEDEIVITCKERNDKIIFIEDIIKNALGTADTILLTSSDTQYFIPINKLLFCESVDGKTVCHTENEIFFSSYKLYEPEMILQSTFCRASKSCIINCKRIYSIKKNISGASEVRFDSSSKKAYLSRNYYKPFMEKINEMRLR
jgi:DNA-binding LytR/AlgR family response regulator